MPPPWVEALLMAFWIAPEQSPLAGKETGWFAVPIVRAVVARFGIVCCSSFSIAASTLLGEVASMAAGIAAARGRTKAAVPVRPRNFLRDKSIFLIKPPKKHDF